MVLLNWPQLNRTIAHHGQLREGGDAEDDDMDWQAGDDDDEMDVDDGDVEGAEEEDEDEDDEEAGFVDMNQAIANMTEEEVTLALNPNVDRVPAVAQQPDSSKLHIRIRKQDPGTAPYFRAFNYRAPVDWNE